MADTSGMPLPGTYIRPVGSVGRCYCYRVDRIVDGSMSLHPDLARAMCQRWGMRDNLPFDDGHVSQRAKFGLTLISVRPGVWREPRDDDDWDTPVYWVATGDPVGQLALFA